MKNILSAITGACVALALFVAGQVHASLAGTKVFNGGQPYRDLGTLVDALSIDSSRSFSVVNADIVGFSTLVLYLDFTHSSASAVVVTCTGSDDDGTTDFPLQTCATSSGVCTLSDASWSKSVSADDEWVVRVDVSGISHAECSVVGTAADGSDVITVTGRLSSK